MISFSRFPSYIGILVLLSSLIYLYQHGTIIQTNLDSNEYWRNLKQTAENQVNHLKPQRPLRPASNRTASALPTQHVESQRLSHKCPDLKPNLILSAIDGARWQDQIFIFMQSMEIALSEESLALHRSSLCPAAPVLVKIIVPQTLLQSLPSGFQSLMKRYPSLEFVGALPEIADVPVVLRRFQGWSNLMDAEGSQYDKVLACDLDVVFQRNPFAMAMKPDVELLYFAEWRGLKIGQCSVHMEWFHQCASTEAGSFIPKNQSSTYMPKDRICAGSVYGTAQAIRVYMDTMAGQLKLSSYQCNDQAMHIHIFYSSLLDKNLRTMGLGHTELVANAEALFGSVGTTPMVTFNEWGEILNERGQVQHAIHQYKTHWLLSDIVLRKYGWLAEVGKVDNIPAVPVLGEDSKSPDDSSRKHQEEQVSGEEDSSGDSGRDLKHIRQDQDTKTPTTLKEYRLMNVSGKSCGDYTLLCSCKYDDCQVHYETY